MLLSAVAAPGTVKARERQQGIFLSLTSESCDLCSENCLKKNAAEHGGATLSRVGFIQLSLT